MTDIKKKITHWELLSVEKPSRYLAGEANQIAPKLNPALRACIAFPDLYELGMSNLAVKIFYEQLNSRSDISAERVFCPWTDYEHLLRTKKLPLYALESGNPLRSFDVVFISVPYEMTYTNILNMLDLADIPLLWQERNNGPLIIAGGLSVSNPLPLSDFIDAFFIGEGEEAIDEISNCLIEAKNKKFNNSQTREVLSSIEGMWVPQFPKNVKRRVYKNFATTPPPLKPIIPNVQTIHNRANLEIFRGCTQGCRFCNAGYLYRPKRERQVDFLLQHGKTLLQNTGEESLGLLSLSTSDYSSLNSLIDAIEKTKLYPEQTVSVPSMRMNQNTLNLLESSSKIKKGGLTFAPEAGTKKLRDVIKKNITFEDIVEVITATKSSLYRTIKLYFMIGLPFETDQDTEGIADLVLELDKIALQAKAKKHFNISISGFVPKPATPFQWAPQASMEELKRKREIIRKKIPKIKCSWREEYLCMLETVFSRGDKDVCKLLLEAHKLGCRFDGWHEHFNISKWQKAFEISGIDYLHYTQRIPLADELPWGFIDFKTPIEYLKEEYLDAAKIAGADVSIL